jgi:hypothetical protein
VSGETEINVSGWTVDTLKELLDERYQAQTRALDAAFAAQQTAMRTALDAAEDAVKAALSSAEKAVAKAEVAAEKRFESVNEFRAQLTDQAATFVNRNEAEIRIGSLAEKLDTETKRNANRIGELELRVNSRLDILAGAAAGSANTRTESRLDTGTIIQIVSVLIAFGAILLVVFHK